MDQNAKALIVYEGNKIRDDLINKLEMFSHHDSFMMVEGLPYDDVIEATPISYKPHDRSYLSHLKVVKTGSSSKRSSIPNCRKSTIAKEEEISVNWRIKATQRPTGTWDKEYHHKVHPIKFRSLVGVERFEANGTRPPKRKRNGNGKKIETVERVERELVAEDPEEVVTIEMFLADALNNLLNLFSGQQNLTADLSKTPPPNTV